MRKYLGTVFIVILVFFFAGCLMVTHSLLQQFHLEQPKVSGASILFLKLNGVIVDGQDFLHDLDKYSGDRDIKGVLVQVNSPGGVVGPSQEIYAELNRVRTELHKPVVVSVSSLAASGAFYASVAADKIVTNPGSLVGSIGVIMEFADLEKLYDWAKIKRYVIKTGKYKDSGAEYRAMRPDEKALFQSLADDVLEQFKTTVAKARHLPIDQVSAIADGRVFTGEQAVKMHLADQVGTLTDAKRLIGKMTGLGDNPDIFVPPPRRPQYFMNLFDSKTQVPDFEKPIRELLQVQFWGQPLLLYPAALADAGGQ